ncbi:MAG TPA: HK97 gp10 family phage protein [Pedococcus sp.]|nr:HK97 gp10 family phage protein [Pedococcus sp.]
MAVIVLGRYYLDKAGLGRYMGGSRDLYRCLYMRARQGASLARALAPRGPTGAYAASIHVAAGRDPKDGRLMALIVADAPYAVQVEHGRTQTKPYRGAKVLGQVVKTLNTKRRRRA